MPTGGAMADYGSMETGHGFSRSEDRSRPDWGGIGRNVLGNVGDAIAQYYGVAPVYAPMQRQNAILAAKAAERALDQRQASLERAADREDFVFETDYRAANQPATAQQRNFENYQGMTPEEQAEFLRYQDAVNPLGSIGPDGRFYNRPRAGSAPTRPVGRLTPIGATTQNTPAPELGANGLPTSLTRAQYDAVVNARGRAATEEWARRNNIRVMN